MKKIDRNSDLEKLRDIAQPLIKDIMDNARKTIIKPTEDTYLMSEGELTKEQRESKKPIGTKGYYRMYRWECAECEEYGRKLPYSEMQTEAIKHYEKTGHKMVERGGVFPKSDLYKK